MATISFENGYGRTYTFEIVDKIPSGYEIWNISNDKIKCYLPLCQCDKNYHVYCDTLKAIKLPQKDIEALHFASIRYGLSSKQKAERALNHKKDIIREHAEKVLKIFEKIC